jgi:hypothetical protein
MKHRHICILLLLLLLAAAVAWKMIDFRDGRELVEHVYDVRELIVDVTDFSLPPMVLDEYGMPAPTKPQPVRYIAGEAMKNGLPREVLVNQLMEKIRSGVAPQSWRGSGGIGEISESAGKLTVRQTRDNQQRVHDLMEKMLDDSATTITLSYQFINGSAPREYVRSLNGAWNAIPNGRIYTVPLTAAQIKELNERAGSTMTAPRMTLLNRQRAVVVVSTETPVYAASVAPMLPSRRTVGSGVVIETKATASQDLASAGLEMRIRMSRLNRLIPTTQPTNDPADPLAKIPDVDVTAIDFSADIPNNQTLLVEAHSHHLPATNPSPEEPPMLLLISPRILNPRRPPPTTAPQ